MIVENIEKLLLLEDKTAFFYIDTFYPHIDIHGFSLKHLGIIKNTLIKLENYQVSALVTSEKYHKLVDELQTSGFNFAVRVFPNQIKLELWYDSHADNTFLEFESTDEMLHMPYDIFSEYNNLKE